MFQVFGFGYQFQLTYSPATVLTIKLSLISSESHKKKGEKNQFWADLDMFPTTSFNCEFVRRQTLSCARVGRLHRQSEVKHSVGRFLFIPRRLRIRPLLPSFVIRAPFNNGTCQYLTEYVETRSPPSSPSQAPLAHLKSCKRHLWTFIDGTDSF